MATLSIVLPDTLQAYVDQRIAEGEYGSVEDFIRDLIRKDLEKQSRGVLSSKIQEALDSAASEMLPDDWEVIREEGVSRMQSVSVS